LGGTFNTVPVLGVFLRNPSVVDMKTVLCRDKFPQTLALIVVKLVDRHFSGNQDVGRIDSGAEHFAKFREVVGGWRATSA
jgi:hypothetical protein